MHEFQKSLSEQMFLLKEKLLYQIMEQALGKAPTMADATEFTFISHEMHPDREFIGFRGGIIGEIKMTSDTADNFSFKMGWEFEPKTIID